MGAKRNEQARTCRGGRDLGRMAGCPSPRRDGRCFQPYPTDGCRGQSVQLLLEAAMTRFRALILGLRIIVAALVSFYVVQAFAG